jgi:hypothetical protein
MREEENAPPARDILRNEGAGDDRLAGTGGGDIQDPAPACGDRAPDGVDIVRLVRAKLWRFYLRRSWI